MLFTHKNQRYCLKLNERESRYGQQDIEDKKDIGEVKKMNNKVKSCSNCKYFRLKRTSRRCRQCIHNQEYLNDNWVEGGYWEYEIEPEIYQKYKEKYNLIKIGTNYDLFNCPKIIVRSKKKLPFRNETDEPFYNYY